MFILYTCLYYIHVYIIYMWNLMHTYFCGSYTTAWARSGVPCMLQVDEKIKFLEFCLKHNLCNTTSFGQILGKYFAFISRDKYT